MHYKISNPFDSSFSKIKHLAIIFYIHENYFKVSNEIFISRDNYIRLK